MQEGLPGAEWVDFASHLDKRRVEKDDLQLSFHRRAAEICDAIFQTTAREVRTGKKGYQLQAAMEHTARHEGCEYCITWLTVAPRADYPRFYKEECVRAPQEGDQVIPGIYLTYDGHWGHAIRTGTVGKPTDDHRKIYDITREMHEAALENLRPGEDLFEVNAAMDRALHKYYEEDEVGRSRAGHGLGYSYEDPLVSLAFPHPWEAGSRPEGSPNTIELKPGMLMEIHPNVFVPGVAGAMIGDMVAVTDTRLRNPQRVPARPHAPGKRTAGRAPRWTFRHGTGQVRTMALVCPQIGCYRPCSRWTFGSEDWKKTRAPATLREADPSQAKHYKSRLV